MNMWTSQVHQLFTWFCRLTRPQECQSQTFKKTVIPEPNMMQHPQDHSYVKEEGRQLRRSHNDQHSGS